MFVGCENGTKTVENNISQSSSTESAEENIRTVETLGLSIKFTPNDT